MTCPTANQLRANLYRLAVQYTGVQYPLPKAIIDAIFAQRDDPEYQAALEALRNHIMECEICRSVQSDIRG